MPKPIRVDNGPEFVSKELDLWAYTHGVTLASHATESPRITPLSSHSTVVFRNAQSWFLSLEDAQVKIEAWQVDNQSRPAAQCDRGHAPDRVRTILCIGMPGQKGQKDRNLSLKMVQIPGSPQCNLVYHGRHGAILGPRRKATQSGRFCHAQMATRYFWSSGLARGIASPRASQ